MRLNERQDEARQLLNQFIDRTGYRRAISVGEWADLSAACDVFVIESKDLIVATHVLLRDAPAKTRLLLSATIERAGPSERRAAGAFNRYLHWQEILHYREDGIRYYDFGGVVLREDSPLYPISRFKLSFGGPVVKENIVHLAGNGALRLVLVGASRMKDAWGRAATTIGKTSDPAGAG